MVSDDKGASLLLRTAASQGTVRIWEAVRHDLHLVQPGQVGYCSVQDLACSPLAVRNMALVDGAEIVVE